MNDEACMYYHSNLVRLDLATTTVIMIRIKGNQFYKVLKQILHVVECNQTGEVILQTVFQTSSGSHW